METQTMEATPQLCFSSLLFRDIPDPSDQLHVLTLLDCED